MADDEVTETKATGADVGRSAALMSALVIVSRLTGFVRTWAQAHALGAGMLASCYQVANNLPTQIYELVTAGMLVTAFLPVYMSVKKRSGVEGASEYTSNLTSIVLVLTGLVTLVSIVFAGQVVWTQSFSATEDFDTARAIWFYRFFAIEIVLYALSTILSGVVNAERDYLWSYAAPIFNNFVTIASFFAFSALEESNLGLALVILALGNPLGVLVQVLMQVPSMLSHGIRLRWRIDLADPALKDTLKIGIPSIVVMVTSFATVSVQTSSALSVTTAGASVAYYARLWYTLPYAILAVPITTAMFTELSEAWSNEDMDAYRAGITSGTRQILFLLVPFAALLVVFSRPLVTLIASGRFDGDAIAQTTTYLSGLALALPVYGISTYLQKVVSSMRQMELFAWSSVVGAVVQFALCLTLTERFGLFLVAFTSFWYFLAVDAVVFWNLRGKLGPIGLRSIVATTARSLAIAAAGAAVGAGTLMVLGQVMGPTDRALTALVKCVCAGIPSLVATYGLAMALRMPEADFVSSILRRVLRRR